MQIQKLFSILIVFFFTGCSTLNSSKPLEAPLGSTAKQSLKQEEKENKFGLTVAIVPFGEKRGDLKSYGSVYQYLIPLVPYGTMRYERPDEAKMFNTQNEFEFNMGENLLKVLFDAVKKSGFFNTIIVTPTPLESGADLILSGDIHSTLYEGKTYSYGISFVGPVLWCFGLPAGSSHKKLNITLYLKKRDTQELLWTYTINQENTVIQGLYHNWGKEVNSFVTLMNEGAKGAIADMRVKLANVPTEKLKVQPQQIPPPPPPKEQEQPIVPEPQEQKQAESPLLNPENK